MPFALALTVVLAVLAVFQLALAAGAPLGRFAWGGSHRVLPARLRIGSLVSVLVYAVIAGVAWVRVGVSPFQTDGIAEPSTFAVVAMWVVFAYFCLGILLNAVSRSLPERAVMVPTTIVLTVLSAIIALGYGQMAHAA